MHLLGTIIGGSGVTSNLSGGASLGATFSIPLTTKGLYLVPNAAGLSFELLGQTSPTGTALPPRTSGAPLVASSINGPFAFPWWSNPCCVAVFNPVGGIVSVAVYATTDTSGAR